jgi:2,3-dihydroxyphenylpropionate 1,2-dioxygenase
MDDAAITRDGGCGGHEIRSWLAANAAARAGGPCTTEVRYYRTIPEWIAGFGILSVTPD